MATLRLGNRFTTVSTLRLVLPVAALSLCVLSWLLVLGTGHGVSAENRLWFSVGGQGEQPGQFQQPRGIATFPDGSFVVVDRKARVQQFSRSGQPLKLWTMKDHTVGNPKGLCALPDGNLLVCDTHYGRVLKMDLDGNVLATWGGPGFAPGQFTRPLSAVADAKRNAVYIVEYGDVVDRVQKFSLDGKLLKTWGKFGDNPGEFRRPSGITVDADGNVYVADAVNHRIEKFDSEGTFLLAFGSMGRAPGELRYPYDIACAPDGLLYIADYNNHRVSVFQRDGTFVRCFGGPGSRQGEFANPWSLTVDASGRVLVSDTGNHRIQILSGR